MNKGSTVTPIKPAAAHLFHGNDKERPFLALTEIIAGARVLSNVKTQNHSDTKDILGRELLIIGVLAKDTKGVPTTQRRVNWETPLLVAVKGEEGMTRVLTSHSLCVGDEDDTPALIRKVFPSSNVMMAEAA